MNHFESPAEFGLAVITFWAKWRKAKKASSAKAKKEANRASNEAEKQRISNQNKNIVGGGASGRGHGRERDESENRLSLDRRQGRHSRYDRSGSRGRREGRSSNRDHPRSENRRENRSRDRRGSSAATGSNAIQAASSNKSDSLGFTKLSAAVISPDLALPWGSDVEVGILTEKINNLPIELLRDRNLIQDSRSQSSNEGESLKFWRNFMKDYYGERAFQEKKRKDFLNKIQPQQQLKRRLNDRTAPIQQQQQHKRSRQDRVPDKFLPFAVYVEKFEKNEMVKLSGKEFDEIKAGIVNAYILESFEFKDNLKDKVDRQLYNAEKGYATFYAKSEIAQSFIIRLINENLQPPGQRAKSGEQT